jgi:phage tail-like protein
MGTRARNRPLYAKYAFELDDLSEGITQAKFQKATGFRMSLDIGECSEGGSQAPMKEVTRASFDNGTLEHGVFENEELWVWVKQCINMLRSNPYGAGIASPEQLRNFNLRQLRRDRTTLFNLPLYNCQPAGYKPMEGDNTSNELQFEELELAYEYFDRVLE